jgi:hypothetical protein
MNCAEIEILICDYADGTLSNARRAEVELHLQECSACAEAARDAAAAIRFMERAAEVEPPPELVSRILFDPPWRKQRSGWFSKALQSVFQPRFAMGMALTVLSFAMIMPKMQHLQPSDFAPAAVWSGIENRAVRVWERAAKFYDSLRFVYQIQSTLREWQQQAQETRTGSDAGGSKNRTEERRVPLKQKPNETPPGKP